VARSLVQRTFAGRAQGRAALCLHELQQGGDTAVIGHRPLVINCRRRRPVDAARAINDLASPPPLAFISPVLNQSSILLAGRQSVGPSTGRYHAGRVSRMLLPRRKLTASPQRREHLTVNNPLCTVLAPRPHRCCPLANN